MRLREIMSTPVMTLRSDASASVPVVVEGRPVGIVSRPDVLRAVAHRRLVADRIELVSRDRGAV